MAACDTAAVIANASCVDLCIPDGMKWSVVISLLCQLNGMACDPAQLMADAACVDECIPPGMRLSVMVSLLCQLSGGGGGGGGGVGQEVFPGHYGAVAPTFVPPLNR